MKGVTFHNAAAGLMAGLAMSAGVASAAENGGSNYPNGVETVASGIMPDPGLTLYNYNQFYSASSFRDSKGNKALPVFQADVFATILRPFYVIPSDALGGAHFGLSAVLPIVSGSLKLPFGNDSDTAIGDIALQAHIGWHSPTFHQKFEFAVTAPTGPYNARTIFNIGNNVWSTSLDYAFTWFTPIPGIEISSQTGFLLYTKNNDTNYQNGVQLFSDFGINYLPDRSWAIGIGGYGALQISDDKSNGVKVGPNGGRSNVFAVGPQIGYRTDRWGILAKWQKEIIAENHSKGNRFWLQGFVRF